jgi:tetratricopeptide (TPR) repeat protein
MAARVVCGLALSVVAGAAWGQPSGAPRSTTPNAESRVVLGVVNESLTAGAEAMQTGDFEEGIRLTKLGLERATKQRERSAALSNLCAAYAATKQPDLAINYCTESLSVSAVNWRAYSNRSYAYYLKGLYAQAAADLEAAAAINPDARAVATLRAMINERTLRPSVILE